MDFSTIEKIAIIKALDQIILVDGEVRQQETTCLKNILIEIGCDESFILVSRSININEAIAS